MTKESPEQPAGGIARWHSLPVRQRNSSTARDGRGSWRERCPSRGWHAVLLTASAPPRCCGELEVVQGSSEGTESSSRHRPAPLPRAGTTASCAETEVSRAGGAQEGVRKERRSAVQTCGANAVLSGSFPVLSPWQVGQFARPRKLLEAERHLCPSRAPCPRGAQREASPCCCWKGLKASLSFPALHFYRALKPLPPALPSLKQQHWREPAPRRLRLRISPGAAQLPAAPHLHRMKRRLINSVRHLDRKIICCPYRSVLSESRHGFVYPPTKWL